MTAIGRGRIAAAAVVLCLLLCKSIPGIAEVQPVNPADIGGSMTCGNCGPNHTGKQGTATGGYVHDNGDGTVNTAMSYTTPNDGTTYSGTVSIVVDDGNGNQLYNYQGGVTDAGNGGAMFTGLDHIFIPAGASIHIFLSEANGRGGSFSAGWYLNDYQP